MVWTLRRRVSLLKIKGSEYTSNLDWEGKLGRKKVGDMASGSRWERGLRWAREVPKSMDSQSPTTSSHLLGIPKFSLLLSF